VDGPTRPEGIDGGARGVVPLRLGILAPGPLDDVTTWSGVPYSVERVLHERFASVVSVPEAPAGPGRLGIERARQGLSRLIRRRCLPRFDRRELRRRCAEIRQSIEELGVDAVLAIAVDELVAHLDADVPVIHHSDTTFAGVEDGYEVFSRLFHRSRRRGHEIAHRAIERAVVSIYPSEWAVRSAVGTYGADPETTFVVPYGANTEHPPSHAEAIDAARRTECVLLWVGRDWERKGGPLALDTLVELRRRGIDATLTVVGVEPGVINEHMRVLPFLNKQVPEELETYTELWRTSAFLLMPGRVETFGGTYGEAAANGLPSIATDVGGVAHTVADGVSGRLLPPSAGPDAYATVIEEIWGDRTEYERYVVGARQFFEDEVNWERWGDRATEIIEDAVARWRSEI